MPATTVTELRYQRTIAGEFSHRINWIVLGIFGIVMLCFIPVIGWLLAIGLFLTMLGRIFGKRDKIVIGPCPVCDTTIYFPADIIGGDCPACTHRLVIRDGQFQHFRAGEP